MMNFGKNILLDGTGLLEEETLREMSSTASDSSVLFAFVLRERMIEFVVLALAATTYLGMAACVAAAGWYGFSTGAFLAAGVLRYGLRGILLALAGTLPQYLLYAPALYGLLLWCEKTCRMIYGKGHYGKEYYGKEYYGKEHYQEGSAKIPAFSRRVLSLLILFAVMLAGCALESFVNPAILRGFLKTL